MRELNAKTFDVSHSTHPLKGIIVPYPHVHHGTAEEPAVHFMVALMLINFIP